MSTFSFKFSIRSLVLAVCVFAASLSHGQTLPAYVPSDSLQGWYPFTGNADNAAGTGKNGIVLGPVLTMDRFGNPNSAYYFNGIWDHILIDTTFFNVGWSDFTISLWQNSDTVDNWHNFNNSQVAINTLPHNGIGIGYNWGHTGKYSLYANSNPSVVSWNILSGPTSHDSVAEHVWRHIVFTKTDDTLYSLYINGILDTSFHRSLTAINYYCRIVLGNIDSSMGDEGFWGSLDDYGIWNRTMAGCEVRRLFHSSPFSYVTVQPLNVSSAPGATAHFSVTDTGTGTTHQWQENNGTGYVNLSNGGIYSGVTTATLTLTGVTSTMNNYKYRCIVGGIMVCVDTSDFGKLMIWPLGITQVTAPVISITPNPTNGGLVVSGAGKTNIKVYNGLGQAVAEVADADKISLSSLPDGMYIVKLFDGGREVYSEKVLKR